MGVLLLLLLAGCTTAPSTIVDEDGPLILLSGGLVLDTERRLLWSAVDNGKDLSFQDALHRLERMSLGGYKDWRFPTLQELESLTVDAPGPGGYAIHRFFELSGCCPWAAADEAGRPRSYPFSPALQGESLWHHQSGSSGNRLLPVRDLAEEEVRLLLVREDEKGAEASSPRRP